MSEENRHGSRSFGSAAAAYDVGRPGYPEPAVAWLMGAPARTVLELGAGTGKLTEALVAAGHDVHATDPDPEMLRVLKERCPDVRTDIATAEALPVSDRAYDVVVVAQAFHWFDAEQALPEIARVLKPGGHLALVWNQRDESIPWVKRLGRLIGGSESTESQQALVGSDLFGFVDSASFTHWQHVDRVSILDLVRSRSHVLTLGEEERDAKLAEVRAFYDEYGRGMDGMELPYLAQCFKAVVSDRRPGATDPVDAPDDGPTPPPADGDTGEFLLIDFR